MMNINKGAFLTIIAVIFLSAYHPKTNVASHFPANTLQNPALTDLKDVHKDISIQAPKASKQKTTTVFKIYSNKENIRKAIEEISLKHINEIKNNYNKKYTEEGLKQRIDIARLVEEPGYNDDILEYKNIVNGGNLYTYYLVYELKPRYPHEFLSETALETLQENGWVLFDGLYLLIYHPINKVDKAYYLVTTLPIDEFSVGSSTEQDLVEIVKNKIPQLELINSNSLN